MKAIKPLKEEILKTIENDTNNGWGFGGSFCKIIFHSDNLITVKSRYCYRHLPADLSTQIYRINSPKLFSLLLNTTIPTQIIRSVLHNMSTNHRVTKIYNRNNTKKRH